MPTIWTFVRAAAVLVGSSAALLTGGIAHADPAPRRACSQHSAAADQLGRQRTANPAKPRDGSGRHSAAERPQSCGTRTRRPRDNRHLSRTDAGRTGGSRGPRANSVHSRSERPDPGDNRTGPGGGRGAGLRSRRAVGEGRPTAAALPSAPSAATAFAASRPTGARIGGHSGSAHRADAAGSRRARVTARAAVVARRAALTHL